MRIEYSRGDSYRMAWAAIDRSEAFDIIIRGWRVGFAKRALPLCEIFFVPSERPRRKPRHLLAMAVYGWAISPLVAVYNHAMLSDMRATWQETEGALVVSFQVHRSATST
jgi:hypothetical protein